MSPKTHPDLVDLDTSDVTDSFGDPLQAGPPPPNSRPSPPDPAGPPSQTNPDAPPKSTTGITDPTPKSKNDDLIDFDSVFNNPASPASPESPLKHNLNC